MIYEGLQKGFSEDNLIKLLDDKNLSLEDRRKIQEGLEKIYINLPKLEFQNKGNGILVLFLNKFILLVNFFLFYAIIKTSILF